MNRRDFIRLTGLGMLAAGMPQLGWGGAPELGIAANGSRRPNILFIMTDQQHAGMMSCAGNPYVKTPAMDSLAANGMRFERAYCANPVCQPSRFSMLTGFMPSRVRLEANKEGAQCASIGGRKREYFLVRDARDGERGRPNASQRTVQVRPLQRGGVNS